MGKLKVDELLETRKQLEELKVEMKATAGKVFKLEQMLKAKNELITQLNGRVKSLIRPVDPAVENLRNDNRELRTKILTMMSESSVQSRLIETLKKERDAALVQLKKSPIEQAAAAPPAP